MSINYFKTTLFEVLYWFFSLINLMHTFQKSFDISINWVFLTTFLNCTVSMFIYWFLIILWPYHCWNWWMENNSPEICCTKWKDGRNILNNILDMFCPRIMCCLIISIFHKVSNVVKHANNSYPSICKQTSHLCLLN